MVSARGVSRGDERCSVLRSLAAGVRPALLLLMAAATIATPGCSCRQETPQERAAREQREAEAAEKRREEEEKNQKKPPLEVQPPIPQPGPDDLTSLVVKPGHWQTARQTLKPNYEDWVGRSTLEVVDKNRQPIAIDRTAFALRSARDVALSKGQEKRVESILFTANASGQLRSRSTLRQRGAGLAQPPETLRLRRMAAHQQHFVVLGPDAERYRFLTSTAAVNAPLSSEFESSTDASRLPLELQYRLVFWPAEDDAPLPDNPLCWTTVAYLLWDEVDPELLRPAQQQALVDWVHWGGQLLVSGPDSLGLLRDSFLDPYLPADSVGPREFTPDDLKPLGAAWNASRKEPPLRPTVPWSGVSLKLRPEAEPLAGIGKLIAERRVGRGRVVVSAMQLAERDLINWRGGYENLLNNLLLRRPPREFDWDPNYFGTGAVVESTGRVFVKRKGGSGARVDARGNSQLRFFARDTHADAAATRYAIVKIGDARSGDIESLQLRPPGVAGGPASWNDSGATASAARATLREAAGVNVPDSGFVILCLGVYLAVLCPFNWFLFKALGRVELAWVAAPIIALAGTWVVVKQAQLDIGFVRAQSEVAILETQPEHPRGHLTRYLSFYTSLSTTYELEFEEPTTLAAPFARIGPGAEPVLLPGQRPSLVTYERQEKARLRGLTVSSNTTDMAHAEQMVDLGGALRYDADRRRLTNETDQSLADLVVVRRPESDKKGDAPTLQGCWIGELASRSSTPVSFAPLSWPEGTSPFSDRRGVGASAGRAGDQQANDAEGSRPERLNFEPLFALALDPSSFEPGEVRAVGRINSVFGGMRVAPEASQLRGATLLVAHLEYGPWGAPKRDRNAPVDVRPKR